jgi:hypothetical protein
MEKPKKPELIVIANDDCNFGNKDVSLQGGFKNFRSYINSQRKKNATKQKEDRENPENMKILRQKFLDTAKSLIGIPYGRKYLEKHPEYDGDLFLDCCGLVRHAVNLLKEDFGFSLGRWNQAYQYDILPDEISFEEMQPGDLIFYSGIFYPDKNMKSQIHNMTHVEIYLGEGEKTIGSRESDGTVEIFDTFQFMSEKYYNIKYHFKSIDTWLKGIHKSFCPEHKWHEAETNLISRDKVNKFSAFYEEYQEEEQENI